MWSWNPNLVFLSFSRLENCQYFYYIFLTNTVKLISKFNKTFILEYFLRLIYVGLPFKIFKLDLKKLLSIKIIDLPWKLSKVYK